MPNDKKKKLTEFTAGISKGLDKGLPDNYGFFLLLVDCETGLATSQSNLPRKIAIRALQQIAAGLSVEMSAGGRGEMQ